MTGRGKTQESGGTCGPSLSGLGGGGAMWDFSIRSITVNTIINSHNLVNNCGRRYIQYPK